MKISNFLKTLFLLLYWHLLMITLNSDNDKEIWSFGLCWPALAFLAFKLTRIDLFPSIRCQNQLPNEIQQSESLCPVNICSAHLRFQKPHTDSCLWLVNPWTWISTSKVTITSYIHQVLKVSNLFPEQKIQTFGPPPQEDSRHQESSYSPWKEPQDPEDAQKNEGLPTKKVCCKGLNLFLSCVWSKINSVKKIE